MSQALPSETRITVTTEGLNALLYFGRVLGIPVSITYVGTEPEITASYVWWPMMADDDPENVVDEPNWEVILRLNGLGVCAVYCGEHEDINAVVQYCRKQAIPVEEHIPED